LVGKKSSLENLRAAVELLRHRKGSPTLWAVASSGQKLHEGNKWGEGVINNLGSFFEEWWGEQGQAHTLTRCFNSQESSKTLEGRGGERGAQLRWAPRCSARKEIA